MAEILVIEDEKVCAEALSKMLQHAGHQVECVPTGHEGLGAIMHAVPDLVVLDLGLPGPNGASILSLLRSSMGLPNLPVVVWTGMDGPAVQEAKDLGAAAVVIKGEAPPEAILNEIQRALEATKSC